MTRTQEKKKGLGSYLLATLREGLFTNSPTFVQLLGMCPTLATTTSVKNALGMGLAATAVLICSNFLISLLRKIIPNQVRIAAYIVIISGFVTAVDMLLAAFLPDLYEALGLFIPLIVVNCIILARAEAFASKNGPLASAWDGVCMGLGFTFALFLIASVREILGSGTFFGLRVFSESYEPALMGVTPPGAFITLGCVIAAVTAILTAVKARKKKKAAPKAERRERDA